MCRICEGATRQQVLDEARCHIIHHGWFLQGIEATPGEDDGYWVYTVGLLENFGHPELVVTDIEYREGATMLNWLGEKVRAGFDLRTMRFDELGLADLRPVHPSHFDNDLVNTYIDLQRRIPDPGDYLQVVPANAYCDCCINHLTDLSEPFEPGGDRTS